MARNGNGYQKREAVTEPTVGEYKGHPMLTLPLNGSRDFSFGLGKANAILKYLEHIKEFARTHSE